MPPVIFGHFGQLLAVQGFGCLERLDATLEFVSGYRRAEPPNQLTHLGGFVEGQPIEIDCGLSRRLR